jgi:hypothetical protein
MNTEIWTTGRPEMTEMNKRGAESEGELEWRIGREGCG